MEGSREYLGIGGDSNILLNSASSWPFMNPMSISSSASNTSWGMMVFLFANKVNSLELFVQLASSASRSLREGITHEFARWLMKTVALLVSARIALAWICVFGGSTPLAKRVMIDLGSTNSSILTESRSLSLSLSFLSEPASLGAGPDVDLGGGGGMEAEPAIDSLDSAAAARGAASMVIALSSSVVAAETSLRRASLFRGGMASVRCVVVRWEAVSTLGFCTRRGFDVRRSAVRWSR